MVSSNNAASLRREAIDALRSRRGRYVIERASQLSGIPRSTIYDWRRSYVLVPDFRVATPISWSYRDLVYLRLLAWLRQQHMPRPEAASLVSSIRNRIAAGDSFERIRSDGRIILTDESYVNEFGGENVFPFDEIVGLMNQFDLSDPIEELGEASLWGPSLVKPSTLTYISPWVMAGEPCLDNTRIPTASIFALATDRGLQASQISALYPGICNAAVEDAIQLERRLRRAA